MIHFLKAVWGLILFVGISLLNGLFVPVGADIVLTILELAVVCIVSMFIHDAVTGMPNPFIIFDLPKLLYFVGKPIVVKKDGEYGVRRGFIVHQYRDWYEWQKEPVYMPWPEIDRILKKMYAPKEKIKKTKERVLNQYDLYVLENSHTKEYQEAMKEVQECLKQKSI